MQRNTANHKQSLIVMLLTLALIIASTESLWLYVIHANAETGTEDVKLLETSTVAISREKYDNCPSNVSKEDL